MRNKGHIEARGRGRPAVTHNKGPSVPRRRPRLGDSADARWGRQRDSGWATAELRTVGTKGTGLAPGTAQLGSALLPSCRRSLCPPHSSGLPSAHFVPISVPVPLAGADAGGTGTLPAGPSKSSSADSSGHTGTDTAVSPRPGTRHGHIPALLTPSHVSPRLRGRSVHQIRIPCVPHVCPPMHPSVSHVHPPIYPSVPISLMLPGLCFQYPLCPHVHPCPVPVSPKSPPPCLHYPLFPVVHIAISSHLTVPLSPNLHVPLSSTPVSCVTLSFVSICPCVPPFLIFPWPYHPISLCPFCPAHRCPPCPCGPHGPVACVPTRVPAAVALSPPGSAGDTDPPAPLQYRNGASSTGGAMEPASRSGLRCCSSMAPWDRTSPGRGESADSEW